MNSRHFYYLAPDGTVVPLSRHLRLVDAVAHLRRQQLRLTGLQVRAGGTLLHLTARAVSNLPCSQESS